MGAIVEWFRAGGPVMFFLLLTSIAGAAFIIERGLALRWKKVIPPEVEDAMSAVQQLAPFRGHLLAAPQGGLPPV